MSQMVALLIERAVESAIASGDIPAQSEAKP